MTKKRIAMTGSHGLIGTELVKFFNSQDYEILRIVHDEKETPPTSNIVYWNQENGIANVSTLENLDAVINLAGANIADKRWTPEYKNEIRNSRVKGTLFLSEALTQLKNPPKVFLSGSAVGFYGERSPGEEVSETVTKGEGFLADLCADWETATWPARKMGIRVIHMRFGVVLSNKGGALLKMLPIFKVGLGGKIGNGNQMMSWVALEEIPLIVHHLLEDQSISGAVNMVSPNPVSNREFTAILGDVLGKPTVLPLPAVGAKIMFGEMANDLLLSGARVIPARLRSSRYKFSFPLLKTTLTHILK